MSLRLRGALSAAGVPKGCSAAAAEPCSAGGDDALPATPIVPVPLGADARALEAAAALRRAGLWVPAIRPPTVPAGTARLRVSLSAGHTEHDIDRLITSLKESFCNG
jgi:8-amino-7-oxononanoate synthase